MQRVVFITGHYWNSKRKAGFHWLAEAFLRQGWEVLFLTTSLSLLSIPRRDHRLKYDIFKELNQLKQTQPQLWSYVAFTPLHPANLRVNVLNQVCTPIFERYAHQVNLEPCKSWLQQANLLVFECTAGLMLLDRLQQLAPKARSIYRVSDDLRFMKSHPVLLAAEESNLQKFDIVSTPSPGIQSIFSGKTDALRLDYHAIRKELFEQAYPNPYQQQGINVVFSGIAYFDLDFLTIASQQFPDWQFHILGPIRHLPQRTNVTAYGEVPFIETIPYIKHADIGLQSLIYRPGAESFTHSLKTIQYTYCQLPLVAPNYLKTDLDHWCYYTPRDERSISKALARAANYPRSTISSEGILNWDELVNQWCEKLHLV